MPDMTLRTIALLAISAVAAADTTLTFTKTWNNVDITVLPHTTISGGCRATAVVTVTGEDSLDALTSLRDLPCPTGAGSAGGTTETTRTTARLTTTPTPTGVPGGTDGTGASSPTPRPNSAVRVYGDVNWQLGFAVMLGALGVAQLIA
ncbi:hypothetical protein B0T14DRAFT_597180 [Immersiella caudata]|uniref:Uncharacterized protein n=1 Tax=Immersiella caudata TaxID=314043 RepID=A0AA39XCQ9_9PEZI|nr:hypothetical protein B0T14DRAFT_597180 [Immersiella caudata]